MVCSVIDAGFVLFSLAFALTLLGAPACQVFRRSASETLHWLPIFSSWVSLATLAFAASFASLALPASPCEEHLIVLVVGEVGNKSADSFSGKSFALAFSFAFTFASSECSSEKASESPHWLAHEFSITAFGFLICPRR